MLIEDGLIDEAPSVRALLSNSGWNCNAGRSGESQ